MEQKKKLIILGTLIIIFIILALCFWPKTKKDNTTGQISQRTIENTYTMYVRINPLVKLVYKESYEMCKKDNGLEYACSNHESTVNNFELLNDDAQAFYQNIDFKGKELTEVLVTLCDVARDNNVAFSSFEIITDNLNLDTTELKEKMKDDSRYQSEYEIYVQFEEYINESEIIEDNVTKFKVEFDANDSNIINQTVLVKANESVIEPTEPTKDGYVFVEWQYNGKKFDFTSSINQDIVLKAVWKQNPITTTTKKTTTTTKKITKATTKATTTKKPSSITSTIDKINLNDNILVYEIETGVYNLCTPRYYTFASNITDNLTLFKDKYSKNYYKLENGLDESICPSYNDDANEHNSCIEKQCENLKVNLTTSIENFKYDTKVEEEASQKLKDLKDANTPGIINFTYTDQNHRYTYEYKALLLASSQDLDEFSISYNKRYNSFESELNNIFKNANIIDETCNGACGIGPGNTVTLTEDLCNKYNLTCDRW